MTFKLENTCATFTDMTIIVYLNNLFLVTLRLAV